LCATLEQRDAIIAGIAEQKQKQKELENQKKQEAKAEEERVFKLEEQKKQLQRDQAVRDKVISLFGATISAAQAVVAALTIPPPAGTIAAIAAGIAGAAQIAAIAAAPLPQFAEGGYTGRGSKYEVAGVVHAGEYVVPKHLVEQPRMAPLIYQLETARVRGYADGGLVTPDVAAQSAKLDELINVNRDMAAANAAMANRPVVVDVRQVTSQQNDVRVAEGRAVL